MKNNSVFAIETGLMKVLVLHIDHDLRVTDKDDIIELHCLTCGELIAVEKE